MAYPDKITVMIGSSYMSVDSEGKEIEVVSNNFNSINVNTTDLEQIKQAMALLGFDVYEITQNSRDVVFVSEKLAEHYAKSDVEALKAKEEREEKYKDAKAKSLSALEEFRKKYGNFEDEAIAVKSRTFRNSMNDGNITFELVVKEIRFIDDTKPSMWGSYPSVMNHAEFTIRARRNEEEGSRSVELHRILTKDGKIRNSAFMDQFRYANNTFDAADIQEFATSGKLAEFVEDAAWISDLYRFKNKQLQIILSRIRKKMFESQDKANRRHRRSFK